MALLKAYHNLDLRPNGVDALGRLTSMEERYVRDKFIESYGKDRINLPMNRIDLALSSRDQVDPLQLMISIKSKELPAKSRSEDEDKIIGFMIGHIATIDDRNVIPTFLSLKQSHKIRPQIESMVARAPSILIIDSMFNLSEYSIATMMAFLLRKLQASRFGHCMTFLYWPSTRIDVKLGTQLVKFGYRPYGIMDYDKISNTIFKNGRCLAMWASRTKDSREE